jgi:hypothetical protein
MLIPLHNGHADPRPVFVDGNKPVALNGCSDPVLLVITYGVRRIVNWILQITLFHCYRDALQCITGIRFDLMVIQEFDAGPGSIAKALDKHTGIRFDLMVIQEFDAGPGSIAKALDKHKIKRGDVVM